MPGRRHYRAQQRYPVDLAGRLRYAGSAPEARVHIVDLSLSGACLELAYPSAVDPGTTFLLEITASILWDPLNLQGEIVWSLPASERSPARVGAQFHHHEASALFALFELLGSPPAR